MFINKLIYKHDTYTVLGSGTHANNRDKYIDFQ